MGSCQSKEEGSDDTSQVSRDLDKEIEQSEQAESKVIKLLLLGPGASGKSTIFKQMITLYGAGFQEKDRRKFRQIVFANVVSSMQTLIRQSVKYGVLSDASDQAQQVVEGLGPDSVIDEDVSELIKQLWQDPVIQTTYENRSRFQITDSAKYFFERLDDMSEVNYIPTVEDILRARVRTTGIEETLFEIDGVKFKMMDVGGQRSERKKWVHCFENVTSVVFVAAISEYDQVLYEDSNTNRMVETLQLFKEVVTSEWFERIPVILFLNKKDLFEEKIKKVPLRKFFPDFTGSSFEEATAYMQHIFESLNTQQKPVYTHLTCATDTNNIFLVFNYVKDTIIRAAMAKSGFALA